MITERESLGQELQRTPSGAKVGSGPLYFDVVKMKSLLTARFPAASRELTR